MEAIFFNMSIPFREVMDLVFSTLGLNYTEGKSKNVLDGVYGVTNLFGSQIRIEKNSYDYEDKYKYSIFIKEDFLSKVITTEKNIKFISQIIIDLLHRNLKIEVAVERDDKLESYLLK